MARRPRGRRLVLTAHVIASVGWLGAVIGVLALAVAALTSEDPRTVQAAYPAMQLTAWSVLVPLALASLATGIAESLATKWGLLRHWWVVAKLAITVLATVVLLLYTQTLESLADVARQRTLSGADLALLQTPSVVLHAGVALALLLVATTLAIYKPRGLTRRGWRKQLETSPPNR